MKKILFLMAILIAVVAGTVSCTNNEDQKPLAGRYIIEKNDLLCLLTINDDNSFTYKEGSTEQAGQAQKGPQNEAATYYGADKNSLNLNIVFLGEQYDATIALNSDQRLELYFTEKGPEGRSCYILSRVPEVGDKLAVPFIGKWQAEDWVFTIKDGGTASLEDGEDFYEGYYSCNYEGDHINLYLVANDESATPGEIFYTVFWRTDDKSIARLYPQEDKKVIRIE